MLIHHYSRRFFILLANITFLNDILRRFNWLSDIIFRDLGIFLDNFIGNRFFIGLRLFNRSLRDVSLFLSIVFKRTLCLFYVIPAISIELYGGLHLSLYFGLLYLLILDVFVYFGRHFDSLIIVLRNSLSLYWFYLLDNSRPWCGPQSIKILIYSCHFSSSSLLF